MERRLSLQCTEEENTRPLHSPCKVNGSQSSLNGENGSESSSDEDGSQFPIRGTGPLSSLAPTAVIGSKCSPSFSFPILPGRGERVNQLAGLNQIHINVTDSVGAFSSKSVSSIYITHHITHHTHTTHITSHAHTTPHIHNTHHTSCTCPTHITPHTQCTSHHIHSTHHTSYTTHITPHTQHTTPHTQRTPHHIHAGQQHSCSHFCFYCLPRCQYGSSPLSPISSHGEGQCTRRRKFGSARSLQRTLLVIVHELHPYHYLRLTMFFSLQRINVYKRVLQAIIYPTSGEQCAHVTHVPSVRNGRAQVT